MKEIRYAERAIISSVQQDCYSDEMNMSKSSKLAVARQSSLRALDPILTDDILCVGGRLRHLPAEKNDSKHPAILPKNHHVVDMVVRHYHHITYQDIQVENMFGSYQRKILDHSGKSCSMKDSWPMFQLQATSATANASEDGTQAQRSNHCW